MNAPLSRLRRGAAVRPLALALSPALSLLAVAALALALAVPGSAQARPFDTGISGIGDFSSLSFDRTREAGASFVRLQLDWGVVAPADRPAAWQPDNPADPHYDWTYMDRGVREAVQAGLQPLLLVDGAPRWAQRCVSPPGLQAGEMCDPSPDDLAAFATAAARRYSGGFGGLPRVQYWQGLNEPNLTLFFFPQFNTAGQALSPGLYRTLINSFSAAIKAVNPANLVVLGGLGPTEMPGYNVGPMRFVRELLCMKGTTKPLPIKGKCPGGVHFDIVDIHPYSSGGPTHEGRPNDVQIGDLAKLQTLLKAADKAGRIKGAFKRTPLWITEFSWDSNPPDPGGLPNKILDQWVAESLYEAWTSGVTRFFWYGLRDDPMGPNPSQSAQGGLYFRGATLAEDQPKQVLNVFRFPFVAFARTQGLEYWGRTPTSTGGRVKLQIYKGGSWKHLATTRADKVGIFSGTVDTTYGKRKTGAVRALYGATSATPFPMKRVGDFRHRPFG